MKIVYIMRGLPGSGKSTLAQMLAGPIGAIHSTDDLFMVDGEYQHDPSKLRELHQQNLLNFCQSLRDRVPIVICDNTNTKHWHYRQYLRAAERFGYRVAIVTLPHPSNKDAARRTKHRVPLAVIARMRQEWES